MKCQFKGCDGNGSTENFSTHSNIKRCPLARDSRIREEKDLNTKDIKIEKIIEDLKKKCHDLEIKLLENRNQNMFNLVIKKVFFKFFQSFKKILK